MLLNNGFAIKLEGLSSSTIVPIGVNLTEPNPTQPPPSEN